MYGEPVFTNILGLLKTQDRYGVEPDLVSTNGNWDLLDALVGGLMGLDIDSEIPEFDEHGYLVSVTETSNGRTVRKHELHYNDSSKLSTVTMTFLGKSTVYTFNYSQDGTLLSITK